MSDRPTDVKEPRTNWARLRQAHEAAMKWADCHPRVGWYIAIVATINAILNLLDLFLFRS